MNKSCALPPLNINSSVKLEQGFDLQPQNQFETVEKERKMAIQPQKMLFEKSPGVEDKKLGVHSALFALNFGPVKPVPVELTKMEQPEDAQVEADVQNFYENSLAEKVNTMLKSIPEGASAASLAIWRKMQPLTVAQLEKLWNKVGIKGVLSDVEYREWQEGNVKFFGTVNRATNKMHGIIRKVQLNG